MEKGTVYFFTGLAGAGKTTIGGLFYRRLKAKKLNVFCMDGDAMDGVFERTGYSTAARMKDAKVQFRLCRALAFGPDEGREGAVPAVPCPGRAGDRRSGMRHLHVR